MTPGEALRLRRVVRLRWYKLTRAVADMLPKGLYARSLIIVIVPMVILQTAVAYFFMERHWQSVTNRLSAGLTQDIGSLLDMYAQNPSSENFTILQKVARTRWNIDFQALPAEDLPALLPKPFFSLLDNALSNEIAKQIQRPFWLDTTTSSRQVEIRIKYDGTVMRFIAPRSSAYVSNSHIFIIWMLGTSLVLLTVAIAFLRNQIRPILRLARAAEDFGKGRDHDYMPGGAREVRQAGFAFLEMKKRVERTIDQRTAMLNGVSHDLRTILTRFKLSLALMDQNVDLQDAQRDVDEMRSMLEAYLAFAKGDTGEMPVPTDIRALLEELKSDAERNGHDAKIAVSGETTVTVRPLAFKRCLSNLVTNAQRYGDRLALTAERTATHLYITVDDDGPGIPEELREDVFRPFFRVDEARNQDEGGTGLGLAIARDIARAHGGDISLSDGPMKGLRATVRIPV